MDMGWLLGDIYGIPRWALAFGGLALVMFLRGRSHTSRSGGPDGGDQVTPIRYKQYRTVRRAA